MPNERRGGAKMFTSNGIKSTVQWLIVDAKEMHCILEMKAYLKFANKK